MLRPLQVKDVKEGDGARRRWVEKGGGVVRGTNEQWLGIEEDKSSAPQ